jgi:hypothetical protein
MRPGNSANRWLPLFAAALGLSLIGSISGCRPRSRIETKDPNYSQEDRKNFDDFINRVEGYARLRGDLDAKLPPLKPTDNPEAILVHQQQLASSITGARKAASRGDIFTEPISVSFQKVIRARFNQPAGRDLSRTIRQGEPLQMTVRVNEIYPEGVPITTVPPTILQDLPKLPPRIEYRLVGGSLVLEDAMANLVVDYMNDALPASGL